MAQARSLEFNGSGLGSGFKGIRQDFWGLGGLAS